MYQIKSNIKLSKNFYLSEFECHDGSHEVLYDCDLITKLQELRDKIGKPISVCSGYRTPDYNAKVGGAPKSQHLYGKAADIKVIGMSPLEVAKVAEKIGFKGIGVYNNNGNSFTHVDVRTAKSYWVDQPNHKLKSIKSLDEVKYFEKN